MQSRWKERPWTQREKVIPARLNSGFRCPRIGSIGLPWLRQRYVPSTGRKGLGTYLQRRPDHHKTDLALGWDCFEVFLRIERDEKEPLVEFRAEELSRGPKEGGNPPCEAASSDLAIAPSGGRTALAFWCVSSSRNPKAFQRNDWKFHWIDWTLRGKNIWNGCVWNVLGKKAF